MKLVKRRTLNGGTRMTGGMMSREKCLKSGSRESHKSGGLRIGQENGVMRKAIRSKKDHSNNSNSNLCSPLSLVPLCMTFFLHM